MAGSRAFGHGVWFGAAASEPRGKAKNAATLKTGIRLSSMTPRIFNGKDATTGALQYRGKKQHASYKWLIAARIDAKREARVADGRRSFLRRNRWLMWVGGGLLVALAVVAVVVAVALHRAEPFLQARIVQAHTGPGRSQPGPPPAEPKGSAKLREKYARAWVFCTS